MSRTALVAIGTSIAVLLTGLPAARARASSGGAPISGVAPEPGGKPQSKRKLPKPPKHARGKWLHMVTITEYWPAPESWFEGSLVATPGLPGRHRIDWLYSARGVSMEGEGIGLDGRRYHIDKLGDGGWVTADGLRTSPWDSWRAGPPYWRAGGFWANSDRAVTFPLLGGGWSNGDGLRYVKLRGVTFARGPSLPLRYYQSLAVDPSVIPLGSKIWIPAYRHDGHGGWFTAQDTGGAIKGRHVDVYRSPPADSTDTGQHLTRQDVYVIPARG